MVFMKPTRFTPTLQDISGHLGLSCPDSHVSPHLRVARAQHHAKSPLAELVFRLEALQEGLRQYKRVLEYLSRYGIR